MRQSMQQGRYILFPNRISNYGSDGTKCFEAIIDAIPKDDSCIAMRLIIPKDRKKIILKELQLFGISEDRLFCDNVDIVCKSIVQMFRRN